MGYTAITIPDPLFIQKLKALEADKKISKTQSALLISALSGASSHGLLQRGIAQSLSAVIKIVFFGSYLLQTLEGNPNPFPLAWTGSFISGGLNAVLGGSLDALITRLVRSLKNMKERDPENWKENLTNLLLLLPPALFFGYAQAGPFGEGTEEAFVDLLHKDPEAILTQAFKWATVAAEGLFLTRASLELFERFVAKYALKDKAAALILAEADYPLACAFDAAARKELTAYVKPASLGRKVQIGGAFNFTLFAYAFTMNESTEAFLKGNVLYSWLLNSTIIQRVPIGAAALNLTACYNYSFFLLEGIFTLLNPLFRLYNILAKDESFFEPELKAAKEKEEVLDYRHVMIAYALKYAFVVLSGYLTYTSSVERAKAGNDDIPPFTDFCQTYLLPIMAIIVNSGAIADLPGACYQLLKNIGEVLAWLYHWAQGHEPKLKSTPFDLKTDFGPTELRHLRANIESLNKLGPGNSKLSTLNSKLSALTALQTAAKIDDTEFSGLINMLITAREEVNPLPNRTSVWFGSVEHEGVHARLLPDASA